MELINDSGSVEAASPRRQPTILTSSLVVEGDLSAAEDLLIEGEVNGRILIPGYAVKIGESGRVTGQVSGARITVEGNVTGHLNASEKVILCQTAGVKGEIAAARAVLEDGCKFNGSITTDAVASSDTIARTRKEISEAVSDSVQTAKPE